MDRGIITLTLNRPERLNALTFQVYEELRDTVRALGSMEEARAVIVTGTGPAFCTGGDVLDIIGPLLQRDANALLAFTRLTCDLVAAIRECPRPMIAAVNGTAAGAGAVIATACDIRIASPRARIAFLFTKMGLAGADMGAAWLLPRLVGFGRASQLLLTGDFLTAEEACRIGLYNQVVEDSGLLDAAREVASTLAQRPRRAIAQTKAALNAESFMTLSQALDTEAQLQAALMTESDFREAYQAFVDNRPPRFR
jgi:enoyl-CoA hydratase/carnithine racemase